MNPAESPVAPGLADSPPKATAPAISQLASMLLRAGHVDPIGMQRAQRVRSKLETPQPLVKTLEDMGLVDRPTILATVRANRASLRLGDLLVELGILREADLKKALAAQAQDKERRKLGEILVETHLIAEQKLTELLADLLGFAYVEPRIADIDAKLLRKLSPRWCAQHGFIPLSMRDGKAVVAFADPLDVTHRAAAQQMLGCEVEPAIARKSLIRETLEAIERGGRANTGACDENTAISIVDSIIREAAQMGASDIHIEPMRTHTRVRYRVDGAMMQHREVPADLTAAVISRVKVLAKADIAEKRRHQDGRMLFEDPESGKNFDLRMSSYVTIHGEKVVLRLLDRRAELINIREIGMAPRMVERFCEDALDVPTGVVLVTGPTGSGKTTTLYSCVDYLNTPEVSIITAEDPVEYVIDNIAQCSINAKINLTFEETLRHIVRQDPDVIVLGEVRDKFSADVAIQAALTGHKVLTTFHTEDSIGGLLRLLNMNIEAFLISSTVVSVVAQRLLRKVCTHCAEPYVPASSELRRLGYTPADVASARFANGRGCAECRHTGYRGRVCVFELLVLNEVVKEAIVARKTSYEIRRLSTETSGLVTLIEDGVHKAASGLTSLNEVIRGLPRVAKPRPLREIRRILGD
ncbi:MAG: type II/IV secretion system protein [Betaproteobacteria bacterium]|nr:MAG: type II/IV secretion system protein [Betaproteobacteria bacterium]